jgi:serine phosphatase RsbU (regulator of sigma subunit)/Tfp pilus assembly protein PilF
MLLRSTILFSIVLFLISSPSEAQDGGERADTAIFYERSDSVWAYLRKDTDSALHLAEKNVSLAKRMERGNELSIAYSDLGAVLLRTGQYDRGVDTLRKCLAIDRRLEDTNSLRNAYTNLGLAFSKSSRYDSAIYYYKKSIRLIKEQGKISELSGIYGNLGNVHRMRSDLVKGLKYYQKGLRIIDSTGKGSKGRILGNIGTIHKKRGAFEKALSRYREAREIFEKNEEPRQVAATDLSIGKVLEKLGDSAKGLRHYRDAYAFYDRVGSPRRKAIALLNIGSHHYQKGRIDSALSYYKRSRRIAERIGSLLPILSTNSKIADIHLKRGRAQEALELGEKGFQKAKRIGSTTWLKAFADVLHRANKELGHHEEALRYHEEFCRFKDSLKSEERAEKLTRMDMRYKFQKQQMQDSLEHAKELRVQKERVEKQRTIRNFLLGGGAILLLLLALIYERFRVARKRKDLIEEKKEEVDRAYDQLHEKNAELEDSIHYASRIQSAILTSDDHFQQVLGEHFVFFKPKEVVSGDFYWSYGDDRYAIWLAADCTGHGVPGAFMSMIGNRLFNEVVVEQADRDPGSIFERVRTGIIQALDQGNEAEANDGMDAALCVFDRKKKRLHFAGAQNPLYVVQNSSDEAFEGGKVLEEDGYRLTEIQGDRSPLGRHSHKEEAFHTRTLKLKGGETLYTFSDGFPDQFGGSKGKKYRYKPFKRLLLSLQDRSMQEQKEALDKEFTNWKGDREQVDDVVVIGVRVETFK